MITALQIFFVLLLIVVIILFAFKPRRAREAELPDHFYDLLPDYVSFYAHLGEQDREDFKKQFRRFLTNVKITGVNAEVEDLDKVLIGAAAIIPVFRYPDWEYCNLKEVLVYPGAFNQDFDQQGQERIVAGMVGTGAMQNMMILSKWEVRQGFINEAGFHNTAIHEFVHLVDKMDGSLDGIPEIILQRKYVPQWRQLMAEEMAAIREGRSDIDTYATTNEAEFLAVVSEYYFKQPQHFAATHPRLAAMLDIIYRRQGSDSLV